MFNGVQISSSKQQLVCGIRCIFTFVLVSTQQGRWEWCLFLIPHISLSPMGSLLNTQSQQSGSKLCFHCFCFTSTGQRLAACNTSGSGVDLPPDPNDLVATHGPLPENTSLFMGFVFMLTASSESDRDSDHQTRDEDEGEGLEQTNVHCL